jgi:hypothetical protein
MTRNIFLARAARVAVTIGLAALVVTPAVASSSTHFYSFFSAPSINLTGSLGSDGISNPFGGLGHGLNLDFSGPRLTFGSGGGSGSDGLSSWSHQIGSNSGGAFSAFSDSFHASSTFSLSIHSATSPGDAGLTTYQNALRNGTPSAWLSTYYSNNGSELGNIVGKDRTNPTGRGGTCPPVPEANTSVTFGLMLLLGLIAWRYSTRPAARRTVRI